MAAGGFITLGTIAQRPLLVDVHAGMAAILIMAPDGPRMTQIGRIYAENCGLNPRKLVESASSVVYRHPYIEVLLRVPAISMMD